MTDKTMDSTGATEAAAPTARPSRWWQPEKAITAFAGADMPAAMVGLGHA